GQARRRGADRPRRRASRAAAIPLLLANRRARAEESAVRSPYRCVSAGSPRGGGCTRMRDPRDEQYARLLVETCIDVQPGWQVMVTSNVRGRPLFDEVCKVIAERGAHVVPRLTFAGFGPPHPWVRHASEELLAVVSPVEEHAFLEVDAIVAIVAPDNTREGS